VVVRGGGSVLESWGNTTKWRPSSVTDDGNPSHIYSLVETLKADGFESPGFLPPSVLGCPEVCLSRACLIEFFVIRIIKNLILLRGEDQHPLEPMGDPSLGEGPEAFHGCHRFVCLQ